VHLHLDYHFSEEDHNKDAEKYHADPSSRATETTAAETSPWLLHAGCPCLCEENVDVLPCHPYPPTTQALFEQGRAEYNAQIKQFQKISRNTS